MISNFKNITEIKGGLSTKKIFRQFDKKTSKIIVDFSQDEKEFHNYLKVYGILKKIDISIPKIYEIYWNKKLLVMEDFGDHSFENIFQEKELYNLLKLSVDNLIIIQNSITANDLRGLKRYTYSDFKAEISEFVDYYLPYKNILNFPVNNFYTCWEKIYNDQKFDFDSFVHKDFEFINLIFLNKNNLHFKCGIIDFQSAYIGFKGWDLFSILENPRMFFTTKYNLDLIKYYYENVNIHIEFETFLRQYYLLNLGRHTRLLGRWVKLFNKGNKNYICYIESTRKRIISCLNNIKDNKLKKIYANVLANNV